MKRILLSGLLLFCSCSKESSKVEYLQSDENERNNYPFSEAVKVGEILYLLLKKRYVGKVNIVTGKTCTFNKIAEKEVNHNRRKYGVTKFGMERYIRGFLDLLSVSFVYRFRKRPMHFFGSFGVLSFLLGFISAGFIIYEKISKLSQNVPLELIRPVTDQPLFYIALLAIIIGVQLFLVGFLSELIIQINSDKKGYKIEKTGNAQKK